MSSRIQYLIGPERDTDDSVTLSVKLTMSQPHPEDHFHNYGCFGTRSRRSPNVAGNNPNNANNTAARRGLFNIGHGGRTVLPPLHLPFRASRSPAPDPAFLTNQFPQQQQDATAGRSDYNVAYGQSQWSINPNTASANPQSTPFPTDPRYSQQSQNYPSSYPPRPPSAVPPNLSGSRTLPPLGVPQGQYYPQAGIPAQAMAANPHTRSPTTSFSSHYNPYDQSQLGYYPSPPDPRALPPSIPSMGYPQHDVHIPRRPSMSVDRTVPSRMSSHGHGVVPYTRIPPTALYEPEPEVAVKKKRKRADAEQLKVLNETYNRTAFPSTEERIELAKKLGMSARSVQIWFQNKRQAMRQSNRQAANAVPPTTTEPFTAGPAPSSAMHMAAPSPQSPQGGYNVGPSSASMAGPGYGQRVDQHGRPMLPSPTPSSQFRGRSYEEHDRRSSSRQR